MKSNNYMQRFGIIFLTVMLAVGLAGCVGTLKGAQKSLSGAKRITQANCEKYINPGETTLQEVRDLFGSPDHKSFTKEFKSYVYTDYRTKFLLWGQVRSTLMVMVNNEGVVHDYRYSET